MQSLPEVAVFREKGLRLMPKWIFLWASASLLFCNALQSSCAPSSQPSAGPPARQEEDLTAVGMTLRLFVFSALSSGV